MLLVGKIFWIAFSMALLGIVLEEAGTCNWNERVFKIGTDLAILGTFTMIVTAIIRLWG